MFYLKLDSDDSIIILIPAYKPTTTLVKILEGIRQVSDVPVVVVNDGSDEKFVPIFQEVQKIKHVHLIENAVNLGKGGALKNGINYAILNFPNLKSVVTADADGQHAIEDILNICDVSRSNQETFILGYRTFDKNIPLRSKLGNNISKLMYNLLLGLKLHDTQTGLRGIPKSLAKKCLNIRANRYELETEQLVLASREKIPILQIPIQTIYEDDNSSSHFNPIFDSLRIYFALLRYSISSIITAVVDVITFIAVSPFISNLVASNLISRIIPLFVQFFLLRNFVFKSKRNRYIQFLIFTVYVAVLGVISGLIQTSLSEMINLSTLAIKLIVETVLFIFNFLFLRSFLFKD